MFFFWVQVNLIYYASLCIHLHILISSEFEPNKTKFHLSLLGRIRGSLGTVFWYNFFDAPGIRDHTEKTGFKWDCFFCQPKILLMAPLQQRIRNAWDNYIFKSKINWVTFTSKRLFAGAKSVKLRRWEADD